MGGMPNGSMVMLTGGDVDEAREDPASWAWRVGGAAASSVFDKAFDEAGDRGSSEKDAVMALTENIGGERLDLA